MRGCGSGAAAMPTNRPGSRSDQNGNRRLCANLGRGVDRLPEPHDFRASTNSAGPDGFVGANGIHISVALYCNGSKRSMREGRLFAALR